MRREARLKLITWNIQWGRGIDGRVDLERIVRTAREIANFDVLCVQEVADNFPALPGNDDANQFDVLSHLLPGFHCVEGIGVDHPAEGQRRRRFGNAIYSRYLVTSARRHALPWPPDPGKETMSRVAVEAVLRTPLGPIRVTTTHLEYYSDLQRRAHVARLRELHDEACRRAASPAPATREGGPFDATPQTASAILTADFNFRPDDPNYDALQKPLDGGGPAYRDAWTAVHGHHAHACTFCVHSAEYSKVPYCCDFIFVSENLLPRVQRMEVNVKTQASDHQPVFLELDDR